MMRNRALLIFFAVLTVTMAACTDEVKERGKDGGSASIYFEYSIVADEDQPDVVCKFQYRLGGPDGEAVLLDGPAGVQLDGQALSPDSAKYSGVYYEVARPKDSFVGRHTIVFTGPDKKQYREEFSFQPFSLAEELPERLNRTPFTIRLANFPAEATEMRLSLSDTSSRPDSGVNEDILVRNGEIPVTEAMLNRLSEGPVMLYLERLERRAPRAGTPEGGQILQQYSLSRAFELTR